MSRHERRKAKAIERKGLTVFTRTKVPARYLCGKPGHGGTKKLDEAKAITQADHDARRDR